MSTSLLKVLVRLTPTLTLCCPKYRTITQVAGIMSLPVGCNTMQRSYEDAVQTLNTLQSNLAVVKVIASNRTALEGDSLPGTIKYLLRSGITMDQVDSLNIIHVAGTKGKGSTCAFVESLLRQAGLRTGFYSSPHLISVRERIRINGKPLLPENFAQYFFHVYDNLDSHKENDKDMPFYFRFLTCMAFHAFIEEKVDVAIFEVGIGGRYDSTNIIRKPTVVGITSLGLDHQAILGNTIQEIAAQKAGIMKPNIPAITISKQQPEAQAVLEKCARLTKCPLYTAPPLSEYPRVKTLELGIKNMEVSELNAGLAIQIVNTFLAEKFSDKQVQAPTTNGHQHPRFEIGKPYPLQQWQLQGLRACVWPGRFQAMQRTNALTYYLDGAHTPESFASSLKWFSQAVLPYSNSLRLLVFHITGFRIADNLLLPFIASDLFDKVVFCPIVASIHKSTTADNWSKIESDVNLLEKCKNHAKAWSSLEEKMNIAKHRRAESFVCNSIEEVICYTETLSQTEFDKDGKHVNVLITGSLHLIGTFLSILDPHICD